MKRLANSAAFVAALTLVAAGSTPASAAIQCRNGAQLVAGSYISTPYCEDKLLADVAREYGFKVSFAEIRNNPNAKRNVCVYVGRDIRVQENCLTANPTGRRGF
ncbi:MAG: hypothetical protein K2Q28_07175 [Hyphomicrobium sp.]|nr:hypothetical protein [Hyphomicrobium sp.]